MPPGTDLLPPPGSPPLRTCSTESSIPCRWSRTGRPPPARPTCHAVLRYTLAAGTRLAGSLEQFAPVQPEYTALKAELARLRSEGGMTAHTLVLGRPRPQARHDRGARDSPPEAPDPAGPARREPGETGTFDDATKLAVANVSGNANELDSDGDCRRRIRPRAEPRPGRKNRSGQSEYGALALAAGRSGSHAISEPTSRALTSRRSRTVNRRKRI